MLRYILSWKTYRTFKNGLLIDYLIKSFFFKLSQFFFLSFTVYFGDKYLLENMFFNLSKSFKLVGNKFKNLGNQIFYKFFRNVIAFTCLLLINYIVIFYF